jgi:hypothetical protein
MNILNLNLTLLEEINAKIFSNYKDDEKIIESRREDGMR